MSSFLLEMAHTDTALVSQRHMCLYTYLPLGLHYSLRNDIGVKEASCTLHQSGCSQPLFIYLFIFNEL